MSHRPSISRRIRRTLGLFQTPCGALMGQDRSPRCCARRASRRPSHPPNKVRCGERAKRAADARRSGGAAHGTVPRPCPTTCAEVGGRQSAKRPGAGQRLAPLFTSGITATTHAQDHLPTPCKGHIRSSWKIMPVKAVSAAHCVREATDAHLRASVLPSHAPHSSAYFRRRHVALRGATYFNSLRSRPVRMEAMAECATPTD